MTIPKIKIRMIAHARNQAFFLVDPDRYNKPKTNPTAINSIK